MAEFNFPTEFASELVPLLDIALDPRGRAALENLEAQGVRMFSGLTEEIAPKVIELATTYPRIMEFCPNDANRFNEAWFSKGRGPFVGLDVETSAPRIYTWAGVEYCDELPDNPITTAFRSTVTGTGSDVVAVTLSAARAIYGAHHFGLETWATNGPANGSYFKNGAVWKWSRIEEINKFTGEMGPVIRPTLDPRAVVYEYDGVGYRQDVRQFMAFPEPQPLLGETDLILS
ncbi:MAG: hypothetical protein KIH63_001975 [Candidatus Saccharibacteria bacterium]|nr:hypothetical protein [Candidatus Saccharibacteria bacterium]